MRLRNSYTREHRLKREIQFRDLGFGQDGHAAKVSEDTCVVSIMGWHLPAGESLFPNDPRERKEPTPLTGMCER